MCSNKEPFGSYYLFSHKLSHITAEVLPSSLFYLIFQHYCEFGNPSHFAKDIAFLVIVHFNCNLLKTEEHKTRLNMSVKINRGCLEIQYIFGLHI